MEQNTFWLINRQCLSELDRSPSVFLNRKIKMDTWLSEVLKPSWWVAALVGGILINAFSDMCRKLSAKVFSVFSQKWRDSSAKRTEAWHRRVYDIATNDASLIRERHREIRSLLRALISMVTAFMGFSVVTVIRHSPRYPTDSFIKYLLLTLLIVSMALLISALTYLLRGSTCENAIQEARSMEQSLKEESLQQ